MQVFPGRGASGRMQKGLLLNSFLNGKDWVGPWEISYFPNGFHKGPYILIFFKKTLGANPEESVRKGRRCWGSEGLGMSFVSGRPGASLCRDNEGIRGRLPQWWRINFKNGELNGNLVYISAFAEATADDSSFRFYV